MTVGRTTGLASRKSATIDHRPLQEAHVARPRKIPSLSPGQASYVLERLRQARQVTAAEVRGYVADMAREIRELEDRLKHVAMRPKPRSRSAVPQKWAMALRSPGAVASEQSRRRVLNAAGQAEARMLRRLPFHHPPPPNRRRSVGAHERPRARARRGARRHPRIGRPRAVAARGPGSRHRRPAAVFISNIPEGLSASADLAAAGLNGRASSGCGSSWSW